MSFFNLFFGGLKGGGGGGVWSVVCGAWSVVVIMRLFQTFNSAAVLAVIPWRLTLIWYLNIISVEDENWNWTSFIGTRTCGEQLGPWTWTRDPSLDSYCLTPTPYHQSTQVVFKFFWFTLTEKDGQRESFQSLHKTTRLDVCRILRGVPANSFNSPSWTVCSENDFVHSMPWSSV